VALERITTLRRQLDVDKQSAQGRHLRVVVDGRFTNAKLLKNLPANTTLIGRIRRDAKLFFYLKLKLPSAAGASMARPLPLQNNF
jgi:hypothetical protein